LLTMQDEIKASRRRGRPKLVNATHH
jgi:hypothetical protein